MTTTSNIDPTVAPSGTGCAECLGGAFPGWWLHLRRCAACGHVGCCDNSPSKHASAHNGATGHPVLQSFEPGEDWFYDFRSGDFFEGPALAAPHSHPAHQPVPGPAGAVPSDWQSDLHQSSESESGPRGGEERIGADDAKRLLLMQNLISTQA